MKSQVSPYQIFHVASEIWLVPENFQQMPALKKAIQKINDKEKTLTDKKSDAIQALHDNPYFTKIRR
jgi:hypothetical protein